MEFKMKNSGSISDFNKLQEMVNQSQGFANNKNISPVFYIVFLLLIHNSTKTIFHRQIGKK